MGWLKEFRTSLENTSTPLSFPAEWLIDIFSGGRTNAGMRVSELTALQVSTVFTCVDLISGTLAALDLNVYEQLQPRGKRLAFEQDSHWLLHDEPNSEMTAFTFIKTLQCHALLWGNLYAEIQRDGANRPVALWPRSPNSTRPRRLSSDQIIDGEVVKAGQVVYLTTEGVSPAAEQRERPILADNMVHVLGLSLDGRLAKSVIDLSREVIGLALATEKFGGKFFANGIRPTGVFELPNDMGPVAVENFKRSIQEAYGGENMLRPMVAESGIKWNSDKITPNEAQFLETRKHQREEICSIFHVPVRMVGEAGRANRSSAEQEGIELVQYTLKPWFAAWQQELKRKLFPKRGQTAHRYYPAFYYQDLLLPDAESRGKFIGLLKQWGVGNSNDIRTEMLDWNPIGGPAGDTYWMPVNMMDASDPPNATAMAGEGKQPGETSKPGDAKPEDKAAVRAMRGYSRMFRDAMGRVRCFENPDLRRFQIAFLPVLLSMAEEQVSVADRETDALGDEIERFLADYVSGMHKRSGDWNQDPDVGNTEFTRAVRAIRIAVYRDLATQAAKEINNDEARS